MLPFSAESSKDNSTKHSTESIEDDVDSLLSGKNSELYRLDSLGDIQGIGRFANAVGKTLDSVKTKATSEAAPDSMKKKRKLRRTKVNKHQNISSNFFMGIAMLKLTDR